MQAKNEIVIKPLIENSKELQNNETADKKISFI